MLSPERTAGSPYPRSWHSLDRSRHHHLTKAGSISLKCWGRLREEKVPSSVGGARISQDNSSRGAIQLRAVDGRGCERTETWGEGVWGKRLRGQSAGILKTHLVAMMRTCSWLSSREAVSLRCMLLLHQSSKLSQWTQCVRHLYCRFLASWEQCYFWYPNKIIPISCVWIPHWQKIRWPLNFLCTQGAQSWLYKAVWLLISTR